MHIADMLKRRPVPTAGVFLSLTRRCPLTCAHCSTNSMLDSEEHRAEIFSEFVRTFTQTDHPELLWLTGGEPLLRPDLVREVTDAAQAVGTRVALISGLYYARPDGRIPPRLLEAMLAVDHVIFSQDVYHEVQVPRAAAFATVRTVVEAGQDVSFQVVGQGADDPYLADVTDDIRRTFADRVPALVARLGPAGRAKALLSARTPHRDEVPAPAPCTMAAWPVVSYDGTVAACCNQEVLDGPVPEHLHLGSAPRDGWPVIAARVRERAMLRAVRTVGPEALFHDATGECSPHGYCGTCTRLGGEPRVIAAVGELVRRPSFPVIEAEVERMQLAAGPVGIARRYAIGRYAHMLSLGYEPELTHSAPGGR
jgi:pyruvate-formate lyase-activating enzyme